MDLAIAFITLAAMEIVLGIDNIVFIAILTSRLPAAQQANARRIGLMLALGMRILLLLSLSYVIKLDKPIFYISDVLGSVGIASPWKEDPHAPSTAETITPATDENHGEGDDGHSHAAHKPDSNGISVKDLILILGGLFLIAKSTHEIHKKMEGHAADKSADKPVSFQMVLINIALMDLIFSLDSVITAVGMVKHIEIMIAAVITAVAVMLIFSGPVSAFVERHPTVKMLALSFLILIGVMLLVEGLGTHIDKGYIYFAMAFSLLVELLNLRMRSKSGGH